MIVFSYKDLDEEGQKGKADSNSPVLFQPYRRLRYALAKALPCSKYTDQSFKVVDVPNYIQDILEGSNGRELEAKQLSERWIREALSIKIDNIAYYKEEGIHESLRTVFSAEGPKPHSNKRLKMR